MRCQELGLGVDTSDLVVLLATALVADVAEEAGAPPQVRLAVVGGTVRVEVEVGGIRTSGDALALGADSSAERAPGLLAQFADSWGVTATSDGRVVWFTLEAPERPSAPEGAQVRPHHYERDRLDSLASYGVMDTAPSPSYDGLTALAAALCEAPIAAMTLVDATRQWFKSAQGLDFTETARETSFCSDVVAAGTVIAIDDTSASSRYAVNPLVSGPPHIRSYLGVPLTGRDGLPLGALCVMDQRPRVFTAAHVQHLAQLADQVMAQLEQGRRDRADGLHAPDIVAEARDPRRLRRALDDGEILPFYQPVVDIHTERPLQVEALMRWQHLQHGTLSPPAFLAAIEACALVVPVGRAVLDAALEQLAALHGQHIDLPAGIAVNIASGQLARPGLADDVIAALERHAVPPDQLTLELTEATVLPDLAVARRELRVLRDIGVHIDVDDFGVGWSNLARVLRLPVDGLKIDRALVSKVLDDPAAAAMVASTVSLARTLNLRVTAEGVEHTDVRDFLRDLGCDRAQGWLYAPAVKGTELVEALARLDQPSSPTSLPAAP